MKTFKSLPDLARALEQNAKQMQAALAGALKTSAIAVADAAKDKLDGKDKPQDWPELSDAAKAEHVRKGYDENAPLLASGALRDSIQYRSTEKSFEVGSDSQISPFFMLSIYANTFSSDTHANAPSAFRLICMPGFMANAGAGRLRSACAVSVAALGLMTDTAPVDGALLSAMGRCTPNSP
jgi:hypothetical protein